MMEYQEHLEEYKSEYYLIYNTFLNEKDWGNIDIAEQYLQKYWLKDSEYQAVHLKIQNKIFDPNFNHLPQYVFLPEFELMPNLGGTLFDEKEFKSLRKCLDKTADKFFYVIQNDFGKKDLNTFRMKYPTNISWSELMSGNYISTVLFEMFHNDYLVFGDSISWGKYSANDQSPPIDIYGMQTNLVSIFMENFKTVRVIDPEVTSSNPLAPVLGISDYTLSEIKSSLPDSYKNFYKIH